jgi:hypothetical protein
MAFDEPETLHFIEEMKCLDSPYIGLVIDTGIFCKKFPRVVVNYEVNNGASPEMFAYLDEIFAQGTDLHRIVKENNEMLDVRHILVQHGKRIIFIAIAKRRKHLITQWITKDF